MQKEIRIKVGKSSFNLLSLNFLKESFSQMVVKMVLNCAMCSMTLVCVTALSLSPKSKVDQIMWLILSTKSHEIAVNDRKCIFTLSQRLNIEKKISLRPIQKLNLKIVDPALLFKGGGRMSFSMKLLL